MTQQSDREALLFSIAENLENIKIAKSEIENSCLKLMVEADPVPDCQKIIAIVKNTVAESQADFITRISLYGRKTGEDFPEWTKNLSIKNQNTDIQSKFQSNIEQKSAENQKAKNEFIKTLQTFKFSFIIPYHQVLSQELYRSNTVKLLLCFGLFPWVIGFFASSDTNLKDIAWILGIYYAFIWGIVLHNLIQPTQFSLQTALKCVCFTAFVGIPLLLFIQKVPPVSLLYAVTDSSNSILRLIGYVLGVGILEESCKALPVYLFILRPGKLQEPLSAAFYGAMSGLGFAIAEGGHYSLLYASELVKGNMALTNHILVTTVRFISLPLIHAIWAGIVGYFIGLAAINPSRQKAIIFLGVTIAAVLHGVYNTFANSFIGLGVLAFSILLFVTYLHRSEVMIEEMKQAEAKYQESA